MDILGNAERLTVFFKKDLAGSDGRIQGYNVWSYREWSMIPDDRDLVREPGDYANSGVTHEGNVS